jgi:hypothetical protein
LKSEKKHNIQVIKRVKIGKGEMWPTGETGCWRRRAHSLISEVQQEHWETYVE